MRRSENKSWFEDQRRRAYSVDKLTELLPQFRIGHGLAPLINVRADQLGHVFLQLLADAQLVVEDHLLETVHAIRVNPRGCADQSIGSTDVEHEESIQDADDLGWRDVFGKEVSMAGVGASIATNKDCKQGSTRAPASGRDRVAREHWCERSRLTVPAFVRGDQAKILRLSLGALSNAARYTAFEFVRRSYTPVAILEVDSEPYRISDAISTQGGTNAGFDGPK